MASKKAKGKRAKTRRKLSKKGTKLTVNKMVEKIPAKAKVQIKIDSSFNKSMPDKRYHGAIGVVHEAHGKAAKKGRHYMVSVSKGNASKELAVHPAHLKVLATENK